ncbi:MAG: COX15/CtaA family protein [Legionellaceae bacterium]|nr:COX15/CtaA family protein [Legionellaceae bacterium]
MRKDNRFRQVVSATLVLALSVVALGAYTRLTDAGLGCPDWPGCYGHLVLPSAQASLHLAQQSYPDIPIESGKAWTEMAHRYLAGSLAIAIFFLGWQVLRQNRRGLHHLPWRIPVLLMGLVLLQAALGMWTVTLKLLPVVVMAHLLGGILIFSLLSRYRMQLASVPPLHHPVLRQMLRIAAVIVFVQIALGGWVSANYAGISCVGFPQCNGSWWPSLHLGKGFHLFSPVGANYQGGLMEHELRASIQFIHRLGALVTSAWLLCTALFLLYQKQSFWYRYAGALVLILLSTQVGLGIMNVVYFLPLPIAVAHNAVAALLMGVLMALLAWPTTRSSYAG